MKIRRMFGMMMAVAAGLASLPGAFANDDPVPTDLYWDLNGQTAGFAGNTGNGAWNQVTSNWNISSTGSDAPRFWGNFGPEFLVPTSAFFVSNGGQVTLADNIVANRINVQGSGYSFLVNSPSRTVQGDWALGFAPSTPITTTFVAAAGADRELTINRVRTTENAPAGALTLATDGNFFRVNLSAYQVTTNPVIQGSISVPITITGTGNVNLVGNSTASISGAIDGNGNTLHLGATSGNSLTVGVVNNGAAAVTFGVGTTGGGGGTVILGSGSKTWGDTVIDLGTGGIVRLNAGVSLPTGTNVSFASNSTLELNGNNATIASLSSAAGVGNVRNGSNTADPASRTLTINGAAETTFGGTIANGGTQALSLVRGGTGSTTLTGANTYTGSTSVTGGSLVIEGTHTGGSTLGVDVGANLVVNGSIESSTTSIAGTVGGAGEIINTGGMTIAAGGTLAPGNSIGTLNITGDLSFTDGSFFSVEIDQDALTADLLAVTGALNLGNATLNITDLGAVNNVVQDSTVLTIATFGSLSGTFAGLANNDIVVVGDNDWRISYGGAVSGAITLSAVPEPSALLFVGSMVGLALVRRRR